MCVGMGPKLALHIAPTEAGQSEIQHDGARAAGFHAAQSRNPVIDRHDAIPCHPECGSVEFAQVAVIFDDEDVLLS